VTTPVFVRFSTVVGSRGSADTVRDTRGFAVKFYTDEGTFDLVGNNMPVFFIQDGIKFPDLVHAAKPHPDREIPQAQTAHDTFWDFVSLHTEAQHTRCGRCPTADPAVLPRHGGLRRPHLPADNAAGETCWSSSTGSRSRRALAWCGRRRS
jgi:catalase